MRSLRNTHSLWWTPPEVWDGFAGSLAQTKQGEVYLLGPQTDADPRDELWRTRDHMNLQDVPGTADGMRTLVGYARAIVGNYLKRIQDQADREGLYEDLTSSEEAGEYVEGVWALEGMVGVGIAFAGEGRQETQIIMLNE